MEARRQQSSLTAPATGILMKNVPCCFKMRLYCVALLVWREDPLYLEVLEELMKEGLMLNRCPVFPTTLPAAPLRAVLPKPIATQSSGISGIRGTICGVDCYD